jgi:putative transposase
MPRRPRLFVPGCLHHVMARGLEGMDLFRDNNDRRYFLGLLSKNLKTADMRCYAWVLMRNHYHIVIRTSDMPLSTLMKPLNAHYAGYFNKRHKRRGYLFQDRFKSVATQDQLYAEELIRYVHLNPIRAGICKNLDVLDRYLWSGHAAIMGRQNYPFQDVNTVLRRFGKDNRESRKHYREFLEEGIKNPENSLIEKVRGRTAGVRRSENPCLWVIGDQDFVKKALKTDQERRLRIARYATEGWNLERLSIRVTKALGIDATAIKDRGRDNAVSNARKILAYIAYRQFDLPVNVIARFLGVSGSAVSMMLKKGAEMYNSNTFSLND